MKTKQPSAKVLPDPEVCRAEHAGYGDHIDCLVKTPHDCPHAFRFGSGVLCHHPQRAEIVARTAARKTD